MIGVRLGLADLWYERLVTACQVLALAAVLGPLLVLWGLKHGVISSLLAELRDDPARRELLITGNYALSPEQIARLAALPEVGFLAPKPRSFALEIEIAGPAGRTAAGLVPSGPGDPLLPPGRPTLGPREIAITPLLARRTGAQIGTALSGTAARVHQAGGEEFLDLVFTVVHVLPEGRLGGPAALVHAEVPDLVEAFQDGYALPALGIARGKPLDQRPRLDESVRLYARDITTVEPLATALQGKPWEFRLSSRAAEIGRILDLDLGLTTVLSLVAGLGGGGFVLSLAAASWANVARKRRHLSVLRLLGGSSGALVAFPLGQALTVAALGSVVAVLVYAGAARLLESWFGHTVAPGRSVCQLPAAHLGLALAGTHAAAALAALAGAVRAGRVEPTEGIREG